MTRSARWSLLGAWLLALAALAAFAFHSLRISTDLRSFMPPPQTADQQLLMEQIGEGPGSRLLLLAIEGAPETRLAELSRGLVAALHADAHFEQAINGAFDPSPLDERLLPYRLLLSPTLDTHALDAEYLADQLGQRVEDLASPLATFVCSLYGVSTRLPSWLGPRYSSSPCRISGRSSRPEKRTSA
jgi:predicted exporter